MRLVKEWFAALCSTHSILPRLAFRRRTLEEELQEAMLRGSLRKTFGGFDVLCLGLGVLIGSGWAQFTGTAGVYAGPALIISVVTSGVVALLAGICYAELCVEFPVSGGAFSYVMITFGELAGFLTVASLVLEYVTGMALVARGFSTYLARLFNEGAAFFRLGPETVGGGQYDVMALSIVLVITAVMTLGMRESAFITTYTTVLKIALLLVVCIVGFTASQWSNMEPFLSPAFEEDGIFLGASIMFFSYVGFDALGMAAEEVKNINHIPWAIVGSITASGVLYFMLAFCLVLMTAPNISCPYSEYLSSLRRLNFITVFDAVDRGYMAYVVAAAAVLGSLASLIVGLFSVSRVVMAASRDWLLPPFLARVSPRTQTPVIAQLCLGVVIAVIGMVVNNNAMVPLVSFGALGALWLVCNAMMYRRYIPEVQVSVTRHGTIKATSVGHSLWAAPFRLRMGFSQTTQKVLVWVHMLLLNAICVGLAVYYQVTATQIEDEYVPDPPVTVNGVEQCENLSVEVNHTLATVWWLVSWFCITLSMQFWCPLEYEPSGWHVPRYLMPWLPSTATLLVVFSVAALPNSGYWKIGAYYAGALVFYLLFSLPMSYVKHSRVDFVDDDYTVVELAFIEGTWRPARQALMLTGTTKYGGASTGGATSPGNRSIDLKGFYPSGSGAVSPALRSVERGFPSGPSGGPSGAMSPATRSVDLRGNYPSTAGATSPGARSVDLRSFYPSSSGIARISGSSSSTAMTRGIGSGGGMTPHSGTTSAVLPMVLEHTSPGGANPPPARTPPRAKSVKSVTSS